MRNIFESEQELSDQPKPSVVKAEYNIVITPKGPIDDVIKAFNNTDNYGIYISNIRNTSLNKAEINKAIEDYFGPNIPTKRKSIEKQTGKPFPVKTKQAMDNFIKTFNSKPNLLRFTHKDNTLIFPQKTNPSKDLTKKIIKTVLDNAGVEYDVKEKETLNEVKLKQLIKEVLSEKESKLDKYYMQILELIKKAAKDLNDDEAYELHEKLKNWFNKLI
jgi:hypothetical protein